MKYSLLAMLLALIVLPVAGNPPKSAVPFTIFAGMNHYYLSHLPGPERDAQARAMIDAGARVIRTIGAYAASLWLLDYSTKVASACSEADGGWPTEIGYCRRKS